MSKQVKVGRWYKFDTNGYDQIDKKAEVNDGDIVQVVNLPGAPKANTMGQCYIQDAEEKFLGMVDTRSLVDCPQPKPDKAGATRPELLRFVKLATGGVVTGYGDGSQKREFAKLGQKVARLIASKLGYKDGEFEVRYNASGVAGSGDIVLHSKDLYMNLGQGSMASQLGFMYRRCSGMQDYTGGRNCWMKYEQLRNINVAVAQFDAARQPLFQVMASL